MDLDGVLLFHNIAPDAPTEKLIFADEKKYRIAEWAGEFLQFLSDIPQSRVSFYSAMANRRNIAALDQIVLPNGKTAAQIATSESGEVRIFETDSTSGYRPVKDLKKLPFSISIDSAISIDDQDGNVADNQTRNFLHAFDFTLSDIYPERPYNLTNRYQREFFQARNELPRLAGLIHSALENMGESSWGFVDALSILQWQTPPGTSRVAGEQWASLPPVNESIFSESIYDSGIRLLTATKIGVASQHNGNCAKILTEDRPPQP